MNPVDQQARIRRTVWKLVIAIPAMFAFAVFALPPIYDTACRILGIQGKLSAVASDTGEAMAVDTSRTVTVEFIANLNGQTPMTFTGPEKARLRVHPGELVQVTYRAGNTAGQAIDTQAVHSITPGYIAKHIRLMECFCFEKQTFEAGETRDLPLAFAVSPDLPKDIENISFSYTFFLLSQAPAGHAGEGHGDAGHADGNHGDAGHADGGHGEAQAI